MEAVQQHVQQVTDTLTNPVATGVTGGTGLWIFLSKEIPTIVGVLTALVLFCQLCILGYKFYKWLLGKKAKH